MKKVPRARVRFLYPAEEKLLTPEVAQDAIVWPHYPLVSPSIRGCGSVKSFD